MSSVVILSTIMFSVVMETVIVLSVNEHDAIMSFVTLS